MIPQDMIRKECLKLTGYPTHNPTDFLRFTQRLDDGTLELIRKTNCFATTHLYTDRGSKEIKQCEQIKANILTLLMLEISHRPILRPNDPIELSKFRNKMAIDASALFQIAAFRTLDLDNAVKIDPSLQKIAVESLELTKKLKELATSTDECVKRAAERSTFPKEKS